MAIVDDESNYFGNYESFTPEFKIEVFNKLIEREIIVRDENRK